MASSPLMAVVAEEQELWRNGISSLLKRHLGFATVYHARSYQELVSGLENDPPPTIAVVNLGLTGMQGVSGIGSLRTQFPGVRLAVVGEGADRETILGALEAGSHGFIPQGFQAREILAAFTFILRGQVFVPPNLPEMPDKPPRADATRPLAVPPGTGLTQRQQEVVRLLAEGYSNKEIARSLNITEGTVKVHVNAAFRILGVHNRVGAAIALRMKK